MMMDGRKLESQGKLESLESLESWKAIWIHDTLSREDIQDIWILIPLT